jgi:octaheme c-type cytochrome (tetrathionate reductase family)
MRGALHIGRLLAAIGFLGMFGPAVAVAGSTGDHGKFRELKTDFKSGPEVTRACLRCHTEAGKQIMATKHWKWEAINPNGEQALGKKRLANNFCINISSNYPYCTSCHVGYGWKDKKFDFTDEDKIDCLACHDTTGTYRKPEGHAGHPVYEDVEDPPGSGLIMRAVDLKKVAQSVGKTSRYTCGACHFYSGGGDGVKHGDLDSSLGAPDRDLDVHMDALGHDFSCSTCHMTTGHEVPGSRYAPTAKDRGDRHIRGKVDASNPATCEACHGNRPHRYESVINRKPPPGYSKVALASMLNNHTEKIACQTCHIPTVARGGVPTRMLWDWSTSGKMGPDGKPQYVKNEKGQLVYDTRKGTFAVTENLVPDYVWFNGNVKYALMGDKVDKKSGLLTLNQFEGNAKDGKSRIWPVKVFKGVQPYDPVHQTLVVPHTYGTDDNAYFTHFNWKQSVTAAMADLGMPFSGQIDFIQTQTLFPLTHMVAPREKALACSECHNKRGSLSEGRMKNVSGLKRIAPMDMGY